MAANVDQKRQKDLRIKTGVVRRLAKEKVYYEKESQTEKAKCDKMKGDGVEEHSVKKQEEVWQESLMMIPDCERKLSAAWDDLKKLTESETDLAETEEYKGAVAILEDSKAAAKR